MPTPRTKSPTGRADRGSPGTSGSARPAEPGIGDRVEGLGIGQGTGVVTRVVRYRGRWTRVLVRVATGCIPMPAGGGGPSSPSELPCAEVSISREEWERLRSR